MAYDNYPSVRTRIVPIDSNGNPVTSGNQVGVSSINTLAGNVTIAGAGVIAVNTAGQTITVSASGMGTGDVVGPSGATANAVAVYNGTTGKLIKDSQILINGSEISATSLSLSGNGITMSPKVSVNINLDDSLVGNQQFNVNFAGESYTTISAQAGVVFVGKHLQMSNPASNFYPTVSGTVNVGIDTNPFSGVYANQYATSVVPNIVAGPTGSTVALNWNNGSVDTLTVNTTGNVAVTLANGIAGSTYILKTVNASGGTISWPTGTVIWPAASSGTMTTGVGSVDLFTFVYDGTKYLANANNDYR